MHVFNIQHADPTFEKNYIFKRYYLILNKVKDKTFYIILDTASIYDTLLPLSLQFHTILHVLETYLYASS